MRMAFHGALLSALCALPLAASAQVPARSSPARAIYYLINSQTGTSYTAVAADHGKLLTFNNASAVSVTLPQAGTAGFPKGWYFLVENLGAGTVTITPTTSTIDGTISVALSQHRGVWIIGDGTNYFTQRGSGLVTETQTLDQAFDQGKTIDGANSLANAQRTGDATNQWCSYRDATDGLKFRPCTATNTSTEILTNFTWSLRDEEGAANIETVDPDAASAGLIWSYPTAAYRPRKSIYWSAGAMSSDGTNCANPAEVTINSGPKLYSIICTDNDGSRMHGSVMMPDSWDAGTVTFQAIYVQTAVNTAALNLDVAAACRDPTTTINATYGTEVAIDDAAVTGSNGVDATTSGAVTANGTCAAGDFLYWYLDVDAVGTTTAMATLNFLGVKMEYTVNSRSD